MKSKRAKGAKGAKAAKTASIPISVGKKTKFEQCWYCDLNADAGAEAGVILTKPDDDFTYYIPRSEKVTTLSTSVSIPRCVECKIAHNKVDNFAFNAARDADRCR